ncbi:hypothetical protein [Bythopirellula polymerisocia]|uniref:Uncharacterized protein n=1 Tax=Bythopirellula polymerisocia TaxID=2528003 RepID=A0A5C6D3Q8_9BACT|nr:hypothetical protein [Bythopirellula polymerisocia]TWU30287.1 hypothetical protein Pla144_10730 [Bythopirellula polymerisocia]
MIRKLIVMAAVLVVLHCMTASPASARVISSRNPFRSYNISGINYGSMQWESSHRGRSNYQYRSGRSGFRRR